MGRYMDEYRSKLRTADEVAKLIKDDDEVSMGHFAMAPIKFDEALAKRADELHGVVMRACCPIFLPQTAIAGYPDRQPFIWMSGFFSPYDRHLASMGLCRYSTQNYGFTPHIARRGYSKKSNYFVLIL